MICNELGKNIQQIIIRIKLFYEGHRKKIE